MTIKCNKCGYVQYSKGRKWFRCKWCGCLIYLKGKVRNDKT